MRTEKLLRCSEQESIKFILLKIVIDVAMYMVNYRSQKAWVFPQKREASRAKGDKK